MSGRDIDLGFGDERPRGRFTGRRGGGRGRGRGLRRSSDRERGVRGTGRSMRGRGGSRRPIESKTTANDTTKAKAKYRKVLADKEKKINSNVCGSRRDRDYDGGHNARIPPKYRC